MTVAVDFINEREGDTLERMSTGMYKFDGRYAKRFVKMALRDLPNVQEIYQYERKRVSDKLNHLEVIKVIYKI